MLPYSPRKSELFKINTNSENMINKELNLLTKTDKLQSKIKKLRKLLISNNKD